MAVCSSGSLDEHSLHFHVLVPLSPLEVRDYVRVDLHHPVREFSQALDNIALDLLRALNDFHCSDRHLLVECHCVGCLTLHFLEPSSLQKDTEDLESLLRRRVQCLPKSIQRCSLLVDEELKLGFGLVKRASCVLLSY